MYTLKQIPEDFIVNERSSVNIKISGKYLYYTLIKKNKNTLDVIQKLSQLLHLPEKNIGFAGSKDKNAVTEQVISIVGASQAKISNLMLNDIQLQFLGSGDTPISLGDLQGNSFEIIIRNLEKEKISKIQYFPNYFDEQRFGSNNAGIGKHLITKEFSEALSLINNDQSNHHLQQHSHDFIGALKLLPIRLLRMYVNAYQSFLWNETLAQYLQKHGKVVKEVPYSLGKFIFIRDEEKFINLKIPLLGFGSEEMESAEVKKIIWELMKKDSITYNDFIIKQIPELALQGELRNAFVEVKDSVIGKTEEDDLNAGKKKIRVSFFLPKGSYATMLIRRAINE